MLWSLFCSCLSLTQFLDSTPGGAKERVPYPCKFIRQNNDLKVKGAFIEGHWVDYTFA